MRLHPVLFLPVAGFAALALTLPAAAQTNAERTQYGPLLDQSLRDLQVEVNAIADLQGQLEKETDLRRGCQTLEQTVVRLGKADKLLTDIEDYTDRLRLRSQNQAAERQHAGVKEDIELKKGDIARMCSNLPPQ